MAEAGLTLNKDKYEFRKQKIKFLGHIFTPNGCEPDDEKVAAIEQLKVPTNVKELQRFMGMVNYVGKFMKNLSDVTEPLRGLIHKNVEWYWREEQQKSFETIKRMIKTAPVLKFYDVNKPVKLSVDASSFAMGCCLMQDNQPVAYATKALTKGQQILPQIVKEAMAIRFGCKKFHEYIYGKELEVESDHKPLETIFKKPITNAPMRLQKILWDVLPYAPRVKYVRGSEIPIADTLSRDCHQNKTNEPNGETLQINMIVSITDEAVQRFTKSTQNDVELQQLKTIIGHGFPESGEQLPESIKKYVPFKHELTYEGELLLKGDRIIVPGSEIPKFLKDLHVGHPGINSMLTRARNSAFWIGQTRDIKQYVEQCSVCQKTQRTNTKEPALMKVVPDYPFQLVSSDLFHFKGDEYILIADHYSGFVDFKKLKSATSAEVILCLKQWFSVHGIPETFESDGGPQFTSNRFKTFAREWNFNHRISSPHYPRSNGFAERNVQTTKNVFKKCWLDNSDIYLALRLLRNTDRNGVLKSATQRLFSRATRTILPIDRKKLHPRVVENVNEELTHLRKVQKRYYDRVSKPSVPLREGDSVRMQTGHREWVGARVVNETAYPRSVVVKTESGAQYRRNQHHLHKTGAIIRQPITAWPDHNSDDPTNRELPIEKPNDPVFNQDEHGEIQQNSTINTPSGQDEGIRTTRSGRVIKAPQRYDPSPKQADGK